MINPLLNGWYQTPSNEEQGDVCQGAFSPAPEVLPTLPKTTKALPLSDETINGHAYYLQWAFNSTGVTSGKGITCWQGTELNPHFTHPNPVNIGDIVGFDANESSFTLDANIANLKFPAEEPFTAPIYTFDFGDGILITSGNASVFHAYGSPGTYNAVLTVTDSGGNVASFTSPVTVVGPTSAGGSGGSGGSGQAQGGQPGGGSKSPGSPSGAPKPNAAAVAASHSLRRALRSGLVVRYSVSERVSGRFEVMIASSLARRLHLRGQSATGLAPGTPPQTVIGKAILIANSPGHNTLRIQFGKNTADRVARLHSVSLLLRMFVRNSAAQSTTVLSTVTLSR
jgi:PKD domain-containing protein